MRGSPPSRFAVAFLLLLGTLAVPGGALTHGLAHLHEAEHRRDHALPGADEHQPGGDHAQRGLAVEAADQHADHPHLRMDGGVRARILALTVLQAAPFVMPVARVIDIGARADIPHAALPRADPATGPPPRLRAPPAA